MFWNSNTAVSCFRLNKLIVLINDSIKNSQLLKNEVKWARDRNMSPDHLRSIDRNLKSPTTSSTKCREVVRRV